MWITTVNLLANYIDIKLTNNDSSVMCDCASSKKSLYSGKVH